MRKTKVQRALVHSKCLKLKRQRKERLAFTGSDETGHGACHTAPSVLRQLVAGPQGRGPTPTMRQQMVSPSGEGRPEAEGVGSAPLFSDSKNAAV